jgi:hypothetical protein
MLEIIDNLGPLRNNTNILFFSDHGFQNGERFMFGKNSLYPESTNVPLVIHRAGQTQGSTYDVPVSLTDIYDTILYLSGINREMNIQNTIRPGIIGTGVGVKNYAISQYPRCQEIGTLQTYDCMTQISSCNRPSIKYMGYVLVTHQNTDTPHGTNLMKYN